MSSQETLGTVHRIAAKHDQMRDRNFQYALNSDSIYNDVRKSFGKTFGDIVISVPEKLRIAFVPTDARYGVVDRINGANGRTAIVTHPNFPASFEEQGVRHLEAIELAARYVISFGLVVRGIRRHFDNFNKPVRLPQTKSNFARELWGPEYHASDVSERIAVPFRAAGYFALRARGLTLPVLLDGETLPPHIAGIYNPLNTAQAQELFGITTRETTMSDPSGQIIL